MPPWSANWETLVQRLFSHRDISAEYGCCSIMFSKFVTYFQDVPTLIVRTSFFVGCTTKRWKPLMWYFIVVEENGYKHFYIWPYFFRSYLFRKCLLRRLNCFGVIAIYPRFVTCYNNFEQVGVLSVIVKDLSAWRVWNSYFSRNHSYGGIPASLCTIHKYNKTWDKLPNSK